MPPRSHIRKTRRAVCGAAALLLAALAGAAEAQGLAALGPLERGEVSYYIAPAPAGAAYRDGDRDLAVWALADWERASRGQLHFVPGDEKSALVHLFWVEPGGGQYGEMMPVEVGGRRGAAVFIRPDTDAFGEPIAERARADSLFRDTIVYLTCVHELGHALGLTHTANFRDVMYFFGYGGDIPLFFGRYRDKLAARGDIANVSGISAGDTIQLRELYPTTIARSFDARPSAGAHGWPPFRLPARSPILALVD
jgi:hypothetical protein